MAPCALWDADKVAGIDWAAPYGKRQINFIESSVEMYTCKVQITASGANSMMRKYHGGPYIIIVICTVKPTWVHFLSIVLGHIRTASVNEKTRYICNFIFTSRGRPHVTYITVTSYWARWRLKSPPSQLFTQPFILFRRRSRKIQAPRYWPLCGELTRDRWIPPTECPWRGKCFHLMTSSWHVGPLLSIP